MPLFALLVLFVVEVVALVAVGNWIGVGATVLLFVGTSVLGGVLLRKQGRRTLAELRQAHTMHRSGGKELADGALGGLGALLMVLPGLVTDVVGLLLVLPPTRALVRPLLGAAVARRGLTLPARFNARAGGRFGAGEVVDGEVISTDDPGSANPGGTGWGRTPVERPRQP